MEHEGDRVLTTRDDVHGEAITSQASPAPTLADRYPWLDTFAGQPVDWLGSAIEGGLPARMSNALARGRIRTCADLASLTHTELFDIRGAGPGTVALIISSLDEVGFSLGDLGQGAGSDHHRPTPDQQRAADVVQAAVAEADPLKDVRDALDLLTEWADFCGYDTTVRGLLDALSAPGHLPVEVTRAAAELRRTPVSLGFTPAPSALRAWLETLDDRERDVVAHRIVRRDRTLDELGRSHNVTRERIRQLERELRDTLSEQLQTDEWRRVRWEIDRLTAEVGSWARVQHVPHDEMWLLTLVLADLVVDDDGRTVRRRGFHLPDLEDLTFLTPEGVVLDLERSRQLLRDIGVLDAHHAAVLEELQLRNLDGTWVRWPRNYVERGIALLCIAGVPLSADDLAVRSGSASVRSVRQRLQDDPRVQRVTRSTLGLRTWGHPEYTGVTDLMLKTIAERGGSMLVRDLTDHLESVYEIKPMTAMAYTAAPVFVVEAGSIRARSRSEAFLVETDASRVPGLSVDDQGKVRYVIPVEGELLRGSGRPAPSALGGLVGLQPGRTLHFVPDEPAGGQQTVTLTWSRTSHVGPHLGSLRALALGHGAVDGDQLELTFDAKQLTVAHQLFLPGV